MDLCTQMGNQAPVSGMDRENWHLGVFSMSLECGFFFQRSKGDSDFV